jgi:hypothetical protein
MLGANRKMSKKRIIVESKDLDGNPVTVHVQQPSREDNQKAQTEYAKAFNEALDKGCLVKSALESKLIEQGIWNDKKQKKLEKLNKEVRERLTALKKGGIKLNEARDLAVQVRIRRMDVATLLAERNQYDALTADSQAENARIDYLVWRGLKNEDGSLIFEDIDEYYSNQDQPYVIEAANKLITMIYGMDDNWEAELPENQFLKKFKFVDDNLRLVNKDGKFVTIDGKAINEDFQYVNEEGKPIDSEGNLLDEDGLPIVESSPFLDDDGNPIVEEEKVEEEEPVEKTD